MKKKTVMSARERILLLLLAAVNFTHIMDFMIMMPLGNFLIPRFGIDARQFSMIVAAYTFSAGISGFLAAFFVDRFDRKKVLLFGYTGFVIGTVACALSPSYLSLLMARAFAGTFGGLIGAQVLSIIADLFPYERRAAAMGMIMAAFSVASVFGVPFGLYMANAFSWHAPFYFVAAMGLILIPLIYILLPSINRHLESGLPRIRPLELIGDILRNPMQILALCLAALLMMGHFLIIPFLNPFMEFNLGFSKAQTPLIYLVGGALTLFSSPLIGRLADRVGKYALFRVMVFLTAIPVILITHLRPMPFWIVLCITGFWFMVSTGRSIPAQTMISQVVPTERRGSFMSFVSSIQQLFVSLASLVAGWIVITGPNNEVLRYSYTGYLSLALVLASLWAAYYLNRHLKYSAARLWRKSRTIEPGPSQDSSDAPGPGADPYQEEK